MSYSTKIDDGSFCIGLVIGVVIMSIFAIAMMALNSSSIINDSKKEIVAHNSGKFIVLDSETVGFRFKENCKDGCMYCPNPKEKE